MASINYTDEFKTGTQIAAVSPVSLPAQYAGIICVCLTRLFLV